MSWLPSVKKPSNNWPGYNKILFLVFGIIFYQVINVMVIYVLDTVVLVTSVLHPLRFRTWLGWAGGYFHFKTPSTLQSSHPASPTSCCTMSSHLYFSWNRHFHPSKNWIYHSNNRYTLWQNGITKMTHLSNFDEKLGYFLVHSNPLITLMLQKYFIHGKHAITTDSTILWTKAVSESQSSKVWGLVGWLQGNIIPPIIVSFNSFS